MQAKGTGVPGPGLAPGSLRHRSCLRRRHQDHNPTGSTDPVWENSPVIRGSHDERAEATALGLDPPTSLE